MSESKLKSLKVVDLKEILTKASISIPAKSNKQDLIALILANPAALEVNNKQQNPAASTAADDLLAPPEDFDWDGDVSAPAHTVAAKETSSSKPAETAKPASKIIAKPSSAVKPAAVETAEESTTTDITSKTIDPELEKRKERAARFGVPLVETPKARPQQAKRGSNAPKTGPAVVDNPEKLDARAARFGTGKPATPISAAKTAKKRAVEEVVDAEEQERRRRRAERFGIPAVEAKV